MDAENDFDEYFDKNEVEEYMSVVHNKNISIANHFDIGRSTGSQGAPMCSSCCRPYINCACAGSQNPYGNS
jgi:hypothetical protein